MGSIWTGLSSLVEAEVVHGCLNLTELEWVLLDKEKQYIWHSLYLIGKEA